MPVAYVAMLLLPLATRRHLAAPEADGALLLRLFERLLFATLPAAFGLMVVAPALVRALFGPEFDPSAGLLRLLAPLLVLVGLSETLAALLLARGRVADRARHQAEAVVVNLATNALLLPLLGVAGAALAALVTQLLLVLRHLAVLAPLLPAGARPARLVAPVLACVACACGLGLAPGAGAGIVVASASVPTLLAAALLPEALLRALRDLAGAWWSRRGGAPRPAFRSGELD
jgi:O-antigen/teichoic acid export membrane protein